MKSKKNRKLFESIETGDLIGIISALQQGADINAKDKQGKRPHTS